MNIEILYEDNHLIIINKKPSQIVQSDKTGDTSLIDLLKDYIKERDKKPGNVFVGLVHRLDRPVSGVIIYAKTSKALSRLNNMFKYGEIKKTYWAIIKNPPPKEKDFLVHHLVRNEQKNKSFAYNKPQANSKEARLEYELLMKSENYYLLKVNLLTGRHHQIRSQLSKIGCPIKGDLKYKAEHSNPDASISLHARSISFIHPVSKELINIVAPVPQDTLWLYFEKAIDN